MEKERIMIFSTPAEIAEGLELFMKNREKEKQSINFQKDKITTAQALKLAGVSAPTFLKWVRNGLIPRHGAGNKHYYFKSEVIEALRKMADGK